MVVDNRVLLELKAMERIDSIHEAQVLTYLNSQLLKDGIRGLVNG